MISDKKKIRRDMLLKRGLLTCEQVREMSADITDFLIKSDEYRRSDVILLYADYNNEVMTDLIFRQALKDGKKPAYPKCRVSDENVSMDFYYVDDISELKYGYKGIREPEVGQDLICITDEKAYKYLCILPGAAFDLKGCRIGYGKGFYDRFLSKYPDIFRIGLAYDFQVCKHIFADKYDIPADAIITEKGMIRISG